jgi:pimeloyl-ACP methyl ester carboxylesterase
MARVTVKARAQRKKARPRPRFSSVKPTPAASRELLERVSRLPQQPRRLVSPRHWPFAFQSVADYVTNSPPWLARVRGRFNAYPLPFRKVHFRSWDGTRLTAWMGVHRREDADGPPMAEPREGILLVPGMFTTKDNAVHRNRAIRFFREWGYHVLVLDLRGMGESSRVFNTAGWKEAEDVEAAVEYFRAHAPLQKLHIYSESLGAVAAILASARQARKGFRLVDGAVLAVSPFPDARRMIHHLVHGPSRGEASALLQWSFARLLRLGGQRYSDFEAYLKAAAKHYEVTLDELYRKSSLTKVLRHVNVPLLLVTSTDDPIVPPVEVKRFERALRGRDNPSLLKLPWGSHCLFELLDPQWFGALLQEFFDFYCLLPGPPPVRKGF